jgi:hypothetical protein
MLVNVYIVAYRPVAGQTPKRTSTAVAIKHDPMKPHGEWKGNGSITPPFLTSALNGKEWSAQAALPPGIH